MTRTASANRSGSRGTSRKKKAESALRKILDRVEDGSYQEPSDQTLYEHAQEWLRAQPNIRQTTLGWYEDILKRFVFPSLGPRKLQSIGVDDPNTLYKALEKGGGKNGRPLSLSTIRGVRVSVHKWLKYAVRRGEITRNPADLVDPATRQARKKVKAWSGEQLNRFLEETQTDRLYPLWLLVALTGMRRSEALGLSWDALDLDAEDGPTASIHQALVSSPYHGLMLAAPKSYQSSRSVPLPAVVSRALRRWKAEQNEERLAWGAKWNDSGLVFTRSDGRPLSPNHVSRLFSERVSALGLPHLSVHGLRHTFATLGLQAGIAAKVIQEVLGHRSITVTLDVYSASIPTMQKEATGRVADLVFRSLRENAN